MVILNLLFEKSIHRHSLFTRQTKHIWQNHKIFFAKTVRKYLSKSMQTGTLVKKSKSQTSQKTLGFLSRQLLFNFGNNIFKAHFPSPPLSSGLFIMIFVIFITQKNQLPPKCIGTRKISFNLF